MTQTTCYGVFAAFLLAGSLAFAQGKKDIAHDIPYDPEKVMYKTKNPQLGPFEVVCEQRIVSPKHEMIMSFRTTQNNLTIKHELIRLSNYNSCDNYKFKLSKDLILTMTSNPGGHVDEPGAKNILTYAWRKGLRNFELISQVEYSPFKELQTQYRKILATAAIPKAEKLVLAQRKKIEAYREIDSTKAQSVCEDFYNAYKVYGDNLYKQKDYKQAFDIYLSLRLKFGDPQNLFYKTSNKDQKMLLVCQTENSNNDQSEDQFYIFAKRYLYRPEFIPFMMQRVQRNLKQNTESSNELALQILKYLSFLLKSTSHADQLQYQNQLVEAWSKIVKDNTEHPYYDRLIEEDTHLIFLLAEIKSCGGIPKDVTERIAQKDDNRELLKNMTLASADDAYADGLEKAAVYEYKQYVLGRVLLKKCSQISKQILDRYFKFIQAQPYQN